MIILLLPGHEVVQHVDWHGEDDGGVVFCGDGVECLEVA